MHNYNPLECLPSSAELPDSDDTPVDKVSKQFKIQNYQFKITISGGLKPATELLYH